MMSGGAEGTNSFGVFKWKWRSESPLTAGLLKDIPPEIELSDYGRAPSGSESPSGLLNGESLKVEPISDLDLFFERLYSYYCDKGLWCIILKWIVELLSLGFTICFSGFFLLFIDWDGLRNAKCGMDAVESGIKPCDLSKEALHEHPLTPMTLSKAIIVGYLGIFSIYLLFCFLRFFAQLRETLRIRHFYYNILRISDNEIKTMPWATVLEKVVQLQSSQQLCVVKDLSAHDVVMRLMRKENYLIGMLNNGVLAFPVSQWIPGSGPSVKYGQEGKRYRLILTKTLEWTLNWCILQSMFDRNFCVRRDFISNPKALKKRLMIFGLVMLLLSPFLVIFMLVYLFLRHAEQFYNHPSTASSRRWSNLSRWIFREFNEVDHLFKHRINSSVIHASEYLKQFPSPIIFIIAKFVSFVFGGFAAILIIIAFLEESLLEGHIFGRNLFWYAAVFGTITAISRAAVVDDPLILDPEGTMSMVVQHTHYMPKRWRGKENTELVQAEFETLFQTLFGLVFPFHLLNVLYILPKLLTYTGMMLLEEMASIFLTPLLLVFVVPKRVDDILQFIADFTVNIEGVGHVCSLSVFDFQKHGNANYGSPYDSPRNVRSSQGKMEKSFFSFKSSYPSWEANAQGKQFLSNLKTFHDQMLQEHGLRQTNSMSRALWGPHNLPSHGNRNSVFLRERLRHTPRAANQSDSLWLIDANEKNHPYLLDWYYTIGPRNSTNYLGEIPEEPDGVDEQSPVDYWDPPNFALNEDLWGNHREERSRTHLMASTSAILSHGSMLQHNESNNVANNGGSHWWARNSARGTHPVSSFIEPPDFNRVANHGFDSLSDRSSEDQDENMNWRNYRRLSRTTCTEDFDAGEIHLHFDDVYHRPPDAPK